MRDGPTTRINDGPEEKKPPRFGVWSTGLHLFSPLIRTAKFRRASSSDGLARWVAAKDVAPGLRPPQHRAFQDLMS
jgi:hypothetical protein